MLLLDNVDKFAGGDDEASISLNANFVMFLQGLLSLKDYPGKSKLKILMTLRSTLRRAKLANVDNHEVMALEKMFFFLPSKRLKDSTISMTLSCRSFTVEAAAEVLEVDSLEAVIQLEGLKNSEVLTVDPNVKELTYDIHPLLRTFLRSIGSNQKMFVKVYEKAKGRFHTYFMSKMLHISRLLDKDYMNAFDNFDLDKPKFELALGISFKSDIFLSQKSIVKVLIFYLFEAMLDEKARKNIFNFWADKVEDDGKEGKVLLLTRKKSQFTQEVFLDTSVV